MDLFDITIGELKEKYKNGEKVEDFIEHIFDHIEKYDEELNALILLTKDDALKRAKESQSRYDKDDIRKLEGVPIVIKDNLNLKNTVTTAGSKMLENYESPYTATVVQRLLDEGAIVVAKANMDEYAMGSSGENSAFGPTKNPWDIKRVPGGSSSGSAVSVASGYCLGALGSDTGGSIRQPASLSGLVGLKPTYGRASRYGAVALGSSLDQVGPLTRNVDDTALILEVLAGRDENDSTSVDVKVDEYSKETGKDITKLKIGLIEELYQQADDKIKKVFDKSVKYLEEMGCEVNIVSCPELKYSIPVYYIVQSSECSANLSRYDGIRYGYSVDMEGSKDMIAENRRDGFGSEVKRRIMLGTYSLSSGYYDDYFQKAAKVRTMIKNRFEKLFEENDVLLGLTSPITAFEIGEKIDDPIAMYLSDMMTVGISLAGLPAVSIPGGLVDGLPVGVQVIGDWFDEKKILNVAKKLEEKIEFEKKPSYFS